MTAHGEPVPVPVDTPLRHAKDALRRRALDARRAMSAAIRAAHAETLATAAVELADGLRGPVCGYLPFGTEPGSIALVERLMAAGHEVLLPLITSTDGPLDWARFSGADALSGGQLGIREPVGPRLGPGAISTAELVLVPALAADRGGNRLGRGRGHYDRTLGLASDSALLVVLLYDEELVEQVPAEPHDRPVAAALLPEAGLVRLGNTS